VLNKVKGKTVAVRALKVYGRRSGIAPLILSLGSGWNKWCDSRPGITGVLDSHLHTVIHTR
jgi:hypothetical protein